MFYVNIPLKMKCFRITYLTLCIVYTFVCKTVADLAINVSESSCPRTIDLTKHQQVYLDYDGNMVGSGECTYTITNSDSRQEMCIKQNPYKTSINCALVFEYHIDRKSFLPKSCYDFLLRPLCTKGNRVFATFKDSFSRLLGLPNINLETAHVIVYLQTSPPPTTRRTYTNRTSSDSNSGLSIGVIITIIAVVSIFCCICGSKRNKCKPPSDGNNRDINMPSETQNSQHSRNVTPPVRGYDWSPPTYTTATTGQDQSYYGTSADRASDNSPFTTATSSQRQQWFSSIPSETETKPSAPPLDPPPSYESLNISHF